LRPGSGPASSSTSRCTALRATSDTSTLARRAGRFIGRTLSEVVSLLNPSVVVIGGERAAGSDYLIAGIREIVYARSG
jgi:predicted NBD/HSP70 family sugar kinase